MDLHFHFLLINRDTGEKLFCSFLAGPTFPITGRFCYGPPQEISKADKQLSVYFPLTHSYNLFHIALPVNKVWEPVSGPPGIPCLDFLILFQIIGLRVSNCENLGPEPWMRHLGCFSVSCIYCLLHMITYWGPRFPHDLIVIRTARRHDLIMGNILVALWLGIYLFRLSGHFVSCIQCGWQQYLWYGVTLIVK